MKMKTLTFLTALLLVACSQKENEPVMTQVAEELPEEVEYPAFNFDTLRGSYQGSFGDKELNLVISHLTPYNVVGYNVINGLIRNVTGKVEQNQDSIILNLAESGEHAYDGVFRVAFHRDNFSNNGKWTPFDSRISAKTFRLKKQYELDYSKDIDYEKPVTDESFLYFFSYASDSIGRILMTNDGLAVYQHNGEVEEEKDAKLLTAHGSWTFKNKVLTISWQPNIYFPKLKSTFKLVDSRFQEDGWLTLQGEGRTLYSGYEGYY